jgi:uncharacterized protein
MGRSNSSAPVSGASGFCAAHNGVAERGARRGPLNQAIQLTLLLAIRIYQVILAPLAPSACKFYPSCSRYAAEAIAAHGPARGVALAAGRLWRCRPFTQGGVDLVPDAEGDPYTAQDASTDHVTGGESL